MEWTGNESGEWRAKGGSVFWIVSIDFESGRFLVPGDCDFPTLADAKAYCEAQESKRLPPVPGVGEVWGGELISNYRFVVTCRDLLVRYARFSVPGSKTASYEEWQRWVKESGAVRIDGPREDVAALQNKLRAQEIIAAKAFDNAVEANKRAEKAEAELAKAKSDAIAAQDSMCKLKQADHAFRVTISEQIRDMADLKRELDAATNTRCRLRAANEIARKGLEDIRTCSSIHFVKMYAGEILDAMNAAEGVKP